MAEMKRANSDESVRPGTAACGASNPYAYFGLADSGSFTAGILAISTFSSLPPTCSTRRMYTVCTTSPVRGSSDIGPRGLSQLMPLAASINAGASVLPLVFFSASPQTRRRARADLFLAFLERFAADRKKSVSERDRLCECLRNFEKDAADFKAMSERKLDMPMLVLTGEKASGEFLIKQARLVASNVEGVVIKGSGH